MSWTESIPLKSLFIGREDKHTQGTLLGCRYPDGHVLIHAGQQTLLNIVRVNSIGKGVEFHSLRERFPNWKIPVLMNEKRIPYSGTRYPQSLSVDTDVVWLNYDTQLHKVRAYVVRRLAFETLQELEARMVDQATPLQEIDFKIKSHALAVSLDGGPLSVTPINTPSELEA